MVFEPKPPDLKFSETKDDLLTEIIDELVPVSNRGKNMISGFFTLSGIDVVGTILNYEKLKIVHSVNKSKEITAVILWKGKICNNFRDEKLFTFSKP